MLSKDPKELEEGLEEMRYILGGYKDADELDMNDIKLISGIYKYDPFAMDGPFKRESKSNSKIDSNNISEEIKT